MNYKAIYEQFIDDRRGKEAALSASGEYREVHHVRPRALGGDNQPSNLISLTPEDHLFAHLLLAKIHGGSMWVAFSLMSSSFSSRRHACFFRSMYGYAKRRANEFARQQEGVKGAQNGNHNPEVREWYNLDTGEYKKGTMYEMWGAYGGSRSSWTSVSNGYKTSVKGWAKLERKGQLRGHKGKSFVFVNRDGRVFTGTQKEFVEMAGVSLASASRVCRHGDVTKCGWRLEGTKDRPHAFSRDGKPAKKDKGRTISLVNDRGETVTGKRSHVAEQIGVTPQQLSSGLIYTRKTGVPYKGWRELA